MIYERRITSECISYVKYDTKTKTMWVTFARTQQTYEYYFIPRSLFMRLYFANDWGDSPGAIYNDLIRGHTFKPDGQ